MKKTKELGGKPVKVYKIGDKLTVRGHVCEVFKVHPFGTVDVASLDSNHAWRLTGLA